MPKVGSGKIQSDDSENTAFGLPEKVADHKPGVEHEVAKQEVEQGKTHRLRPSEERDIPKESLAARIVRTRKGDGDHGAV